MYNAIVFFKHFGTTAVYYNKKFNKIVYYNLGNYIFLKNGVFLYVIYILIKKSR
jgi:hypothetical protein